MRLPLIALTTFGCFATGVLSDKQYGSFEDRELIEEKPSNGDHQVLGSIPTITVSHQPRQAVQTMTRTFTIFWRQFDLTSRVETTSTPPETVTYVVHTLTSTRLRLTTTATDTQSAYALLVSSAQSFESSKSSSAESVSSSVYDVVSSQYRSSSASAASSRMSATSSSNAASGSNIVHSVSISDRFALVTATITVCVVGGLMLLL